MRIKNSIITKAKITMLRIYKKDIINKMRIVKANTNYYISKPHNIMFYTIQARDESTYSTTCDQTACTTTSDKSAYNATSDQTAYTTTCDQSTCTTTYDQTVYTTTCDQTACTATSDQYSCTTTCDQTACNEAQEAKIVLPDLDLINSKDWIKNSKINFLKILNSSLKGPTRESNWLIPRQLLVGGYPDTDDKHLEPLKNAGVNYFVCLNNEYGTSSRHGRIHRPYAEGLDSSYEFDNIKIPDMGTIDDKTILEISQKIVDRIRSGKIVYLHCSGGHGRTGTIACIVMYILYGLPLDQIFDYVQFAHDQREGNFFGYRYHTHSITDPDLKMYIVAGQVPTPQTSTQREQVVRIIESLK
jgi:hypothetical protein